MDKKPIEGLPGYRHLALDAVASTNSEALAMARDGEPAGLWISARRQTAGRGRRGREWISDEGNLYASLLLTNPAELAHLGNLPFVAAIAAHRAVDGFFADRPLRPKIKWPNDILVGDEKLAGILLESERMSDGRVAVVLGFGINCAHHPDGTATPATDLDTCGVRIAPQKMFSALASSMDWALSIWRNGEAFAEIRRLWLEAAEGVGKRVRLNLHNGSLEGYFDRIDSDGHLILRLDDGEYRRVSAGDLFFFGSESVGA